MRHEGGSVELTLGFFRGCLRRRILDARCQQVQAFNPFFFINFQRFFRGFATLSPLNCVVVVTAFDGGDQCGFAFVFDCAAAQNCYGDGYAVPHSAFHKFGAGKGGGTSFLKIEDDGADQRHRREIFIRGGVL